MGTSDIRRVPQVQAQYQEVIDAKDAEISLLRSELAIVRQLLEISEKALTPFSNAVFNDNGDMTVSPCHDSYESFIAAYFAKQKIHAAFKESKS